MSAIRHYLKGLVEEIARPVEAAVPLERIRPRPQPRRHFDEAALAALAESIKAQGVLHPLLVRRQEEGYEIIAGERRWRAARMAGLSTVPVAIVMADDRKAEALALVENLQREDLNPYEETLAVVGLLALTLGKSREEVVGLLHRMRNEARGKVPQNVLGNPEARKVEEVFRDLGRMNWESFVQARLPLLALPEDLKAALEAGAIPYTAALELKKVRDPERRSELLEEVRQGLSLRDLKGKVRALAAPAPAPDPLAWQREGVRRLGRADFGRLPEGERAKAEELLRQLVRLLDG